MSRARISCHSVRLDRASVSSLLFFAAMFAAMFFAAMPMDARAASVFFQADRYANNRIACQAFGFLNYDNAPQPGETISYTSWVDMSYEGGQCVIRDPRIEYAGSTGSPAYDASTWSLGGEFSSTFLGGQTTDLLPGPSSSGSHFLNVALRFEYRYAPNTGATRDRSYATLSFNVSEPQTPPLLNLFWK